VLKLSRAWSGVTTKATPLPDVWKNLVKQSIKFRRGQVCMVAAAPNAGKSMFALIYAIKAQVPTLFFSADTDTATVMIRAAAHLSGHSQLAVEQNIDKRSDYYSAHLANTSHIQWVFDSSPSLDDIEMEIKAYFELYGVAPQLIIIDNLMNVSAETDNEWAGLRAIMMELHDMARKTEACVLVLHHVSEQSEYGSPMMPPPASVKNRFGPHYADASQWASLFVNFGACQIGDDDAQGRAYLRSNAEGIAYGNV